MASPPRQNVAPSGSLPPILSPPLTRPPRTGRRSGCQTTDDVARSVPKLCGERLPPPPGPPGASWDKPLPTPPTPPKNGAQAGRRRSGRRLSNETEDDDRSEISGNSFFSARSRQSGATASTLSMGRIEIDIRSEASGRSRRSLGGSRPPSERGPASDHGDVLALGPRALDPLKVASPVLSQAPLPSVPAAPPVTRRPIPPSAPQATIRADPQLSPSPPGRPAPAPPPPGHHGVWKHSPPPPALSSSQSSPRKPPTFRSHADYIAASRADSPVDLESEVPLPLPPAAPPPGSRPAARLTADNLEQHNFNKSIERRPPLSLPTLPHSPQESTMQTHRGAWGHSDDPLASIHENGAKKDDAMDMLEVDNLRRQNEELLRRVAALEGSEVRATQPVAAALVKPLDDPSTKSSCCIVS